MSKLRIFYIISVVILGVLVVRVLFWPMTGGEQKYSVVSRESLLQTETGWILQFDILNHEGEERKYTISVSVDGKPSTLTVSIRDEGAFTYIKHVNRDMITDGVFSFSVYKEGEATPFEQGTYYLK